MEAPSVQHLRKDYALAELLETTADLDPIRQFSTWLGQALVAELPEPYAMTLATVGSEGRPSARVVLLRSFDEHGFVFFTNYRSRKGRELEAHPFAALVFYWAELERQVRIEGRVGMVDAKESESYFASRPRMSRLGALASDQSQPIPDRSVLEARMAELQAKYPGDDVPRPPHWGGYRLVPDCIEFWQGRRSRLHDRLCYRRKAEGWERTRLSP